MEGGLISASENEVKELYLQTIGSWNITKESKVASKPAKSI